MDIFDVIVIGAGIQGSSAAYHLAKMKKRTLLLEQFTLPHKLGSSHGTSRLYRKGYDKKFKYEQLAKENEQLWHTLELESNNSFFQETGVLFVARPPFDINVKRTVKSLEDQNLNHKFMTADELNTQFPMMKYSSSCGDVGVYEPTGGVIQSDLALSSIRKMFKKYGGQLNDDEKVIEIQPYTNVKDGNIISLVKTQKGNTYHCKSVIIAAGPWSGKLAATLGLDLPLQPKRIKVCYWRQLKKQYSTEDGFPVFIADGLGIDLGVRNYMYGFPTMEHPEHVKICSHYGQPIDPDVKEKFVDNKDLEDLCLFVKNYFPGLENKPSIIESCIITTTPDEEFIMDHHPNYKNIIIGAGFSGHGFKLAPVLGLILAQLAIGIQPTHDLNKFKLSRFLQKKNMVAVEAKL